MTPQPLFLPGDRHDTPTIDQQFPAKCANASRRLLRSTRPFGGTDN